MSNVVEIGPKRLKDYVITSKSCTFSYVGCKLESKFGRVLLDLESHDDASNIEIHAKRISGNGKFKVKNGNDTKELSVISKISQVFDIELGENKNIEIFRPEDGGGELYIMGLTIHSAPTNMDENLSVNWKELIKKCGKYGSLRLAKNRLFATGGGFIEDKYRIKHIITQPNMHVREGNRIKFLGSCEITHLEVDGPDAGGKKELYTNRDVPGPLVNPELSTPKNKIKDATHRPPRPKSPEDAGYDRNMVIYDSVATNGFQKFKHTRNKTVTGIRSNGKDFLIVKRGGSVGLSMSSLQGNTEYICVITAKKLNGNGKLFINFSTSENDLSNYKEVIVNNTFSHKYINLTTGASKYGQFHKMNISMMPPSTGEVLIERILVIESIPLHQARVIAEHGKYHPIALGTAPLSVSLNYSATPQGSDAVYHTSKQYARYETPSFGESLQGVNGTLAITSVSGISWFNKIATAFPNVQMVKRPDEITKDTLVIGVLGSFVSSSRAWIDAFLDSEMSDGKFDRLRRCKTIYSPSMSNVQIIRQKCPDTEVKLMSKPMPWIKPRSIEFFRNKNFVLAFNRNDKATFRLIDSWKSTYPSLVLVGARGSLPANVIPVNEYLPYDQLLFIMRNSKAIIDITGHNDYESSFLKMSIAMGLPVVSSNWYVLDKSNAVFLPSTDDINGIKVPQGKIIQDGIERALSFDKASPNDMGRFNEKFKKNVMELLGV
jgi:hypothetical protein